MNFRPGMAAGKAEHLDNPMMSGGEQLLQPVLTCQTDLYYTLHFHLLPTVSRIVEIKPLCLSRGAISDYIAQSAAQSEPTHCPAICLQNLH